MLLLSCDCHMLLLSCDCHMLLLSCDCHMLLYLLSATRARCDTTMLSRMRRKISGYQRSIASQPLLNWSSTTNPMEEVCVMLVGVLSTRAVYICQCVCALVGVYMYVPAHASYCGD